MPYYAQNSRFGGPQNWSGRFGEEQTFGLADTRTPAPRAHTVLTILRYFVMIISSSRSHNIELPSR